MPKTLLLLLLFCMSLLLPQSADAAEKRRQEDIKDLPIEAIDLSLQREAGLGEKLALKLKQECAQADDKLDALERRLHELTVAAYYQDGSNFFFLSYYCRQIAELSQDYFSGNSPFMRLQLRMRLATQRLIYLRQALENLKSGMDDDEPEKEAALQSALQNCSMLEATYRQHYATIQEKQERFRSLGEQIRRLDVYANGSNVERYNAYNSQLPPARRQREMKKDEEAAKAADQKEASNGKAVDIVAALEGKGLQQGGEKAAETTADTAGTEAGADTADEPHESKFKDNIDEEMNEDGRLARRIMLTLWNPNNPFRDQGLASRSPLLTLHYLWLSIKHSYIQPTDTALRARLVRLGGSLLVLIPVLYLLIRLLLRSLRAGKRLHHISRARLRCAVRPLLNLLLWGSLLVFAAYESKGYLASGLRFAAQYAFLSFLLYSSLLVRLSSRRIVSGSALFVPLSWLCAFLVLLSVLKCNSFSVGVCTPFAYGIACIWMLTRFLHRLKNIRISARVFAGLSILIMAAGTYFCFTGYYYVVMIITLTWYALVANVMLVTAVYKLGKLITRRISSMAKLKGYRHFICTWVRLCISHFILPLLCLLLIWYGLSWPAEGFDLGHYLHSWMGQPYRIHAFIREISVQRVLLIISVGIGLNCLIQICRQTLRILYGQKMEIGISQSIITIASMILWGLFIIFALNLLDADYQSVLVIMGGMSVGIGLGMKDTIENLICGLSLMLGRMRPGDIVECDGVRGKVVSIGYRTTLLETIEGSVICFQNSMLFNQNFRNMTRNHQYERAVVSIGVTYGTDVSFARALILRALAPLPMLSAQHPSSVALADFADSSVNLDVAVWVPVQQKPAALSAVREAIYKAFNDNGIEIPFPQQDLYIKPLPGAPEDNPLCAAAKQ